MPSSNPCNITTIVEEVVRLKPNSILDVGIGTGKYGMLFRDYLDGHWAGHAFHDPATWSLMLVGIEVDKQYITPLHDYIYSSVLCVEAYDYLVTNKGDHCFDLVFLGDVLEHFTKEQGILLIKAIRDKWLCSRGHILISTPNFPTMINNPNVIVFGNKFEMHKCRWYAQEFVQFNMPVKQLAGDKLLTILLG